MNRLDKDDPFGLGLDNWKEAGSQCDETEYELKPEGLYRAARSIVKGHIVQGDWHRSNIEKRTLDQGISLLRLSQAESRIKALEQRIEEVEHGKPVVLPIQSFAPDRYEVLKPIWAVVQEDDGAFVASFFDANINASGNDQLDAVEMLKEMIVSTFRLFAEKEAVLGPETQRQFAVLREFMKAI
jgi:hypothetical protein